MFFDRKLKVENQNLLQRLNSKQQILDDLSQSMMHLQLDHTGNIVKANEGFFKELGLKESNVVGKPFSELTPMDSRNTNHYRLMTKALKEMKHWNGAVQIAKGNGTEGWLRTIIQPMFDEKGSGESFMVLASELTRTIHSSLELKDMLEALSRSMAVIEFNLDGTVVKANKNFLNAMGYTLDQIVGKHHKMFCEPELVNSIEYTKFWETLRRGEFVQSRFKRIDRHGRAVWLEASYNPVHNEQGKLYKVVKLATDISAQIEREGMISQAADIAYETSKQTDVMAENGQQVMKNTAQAMSDLHGQMQSASNGIQELDELSKTISQLLNNIGSIAEQTNLLALNAAIEAARAGEQGRGFAVVADEVRNLASRTTLTTAEIEKVVSQNIKLTQQAVDQIRAGLEKTSQAQELTTQAAHVIGDIQSGAKTVVNAIEKFHESL